MNYRLAYRLGFHPWEDLAEHPPFADALLGLVAREEDGDGPPFGRALDLGCGSAVWGVRLARRGWTVTGVDVVERALRRAQDRAAAAGVDLRTRARVADVAPGAVTLEDGEVLDAEVAGDRCDLVLRRRRCDRDRVPRALVGLDERARLTPDGAGDLGAEEPVTEVGERIIGITRIAEKGDRKRKV